MDKVSDYDYELPDELIAQFPPETRTASRLLHVPDSGEFVDLKFTDIVDHLEAGDVLVTNNTRVIPARVFGRKESGGRVEILLERIVDERTILAQVKASRAPRSGTLLLIDGDDESVVEVVGRQASFFAIKIITEGSLLAWFRRVGHMPLPPYIERADQNDDLERYQTVFARRDGAVAAPTAGLHFDTELLSRIEQRGVRRAEVTLHVGAGTYQPVRVDSIDEHVMHSEWLEVSQDSCDVINRAKSEAKRVIAVGTTVVRALESAAQQASNRKQATNLLAPYSGETDIFIFPGYQFAVVDCLVTNFHLPQSTLLMLVSALCGRERMLAAYQHAIAQRYRFFSYGDAMLLEPNFLV